MVEAVECVLCPVVERAPSVSVFFQGVTRVHPDLFVSRYPFFYPIHHLRPAPPTAINASTKTAQSSCLLPSANWCRQQRCVLDKDASDTHFARGFFSHFHQRAAIVLYNSVSLPPLVHGEQAARHAFFFVLYLSLSSRLRGSVHITFGNVT